MFSIETPSRVLRRIEALEDDDDHLPTLPDFPEFENESNTSFTPNVPDRPQPLPPAKILPALSNITNNKQAGLSELGLGKAGAGPKPALPPLPPPIEEDISRDSPAEEEEEELEPSLDREPEPEGEENPDATQDNPLPNGAPTTPYTPSSLISSGTALAGRTAFSSQLYSTPQSAHADADLERRKEHLLQTLRSTAKPRFVVGTPHPRHRRAGGGGAGSDGEQSYSSDTASSHDLTTHAKGNTSLPSSGVEEKSTRFNGAKLNSYLHSLNTHLTEENQSLVKTLGSTTKEVERLQLETRRLEKQVHEMSVTGGSVSEDKEEESRRITETLDEALRERDERADEVIRLREELARASEAATRETAALNARADALLVELEAKDGEIERALAETADQEAKFADQMQKLEEELCRVMEEQEAQIERARAELDTRRKEDDERRRDEAVRLERTEMRCAELERDLAKVAQEKESIERQGQSSHSDLSRELRAEVARLEALVKDRDAEVAKMNAEMDDFERKIDELDADDTEAKRQLEEQAEGIRQLEEALDESSRQLLQNEDDLAELRTALASEKTISASLSAQISQLNRHATKAKSPLANEVSVDDTSKDLVIATLETDLAQARDEVRQLQKRLDDAGALPGAVELTHLEERVSSLREQVSMSFTPRRTPDKSMLFRSIIGVKTPKTPGQFIGNLSAWSPGTAGDTTISPLLAQIQELELIVERLQQQLADANEDIDSKLDKLESAGSGSLALARQLSQARERIAQLETELAKLQQERGDILKGVSGLQADLRKVREDATTLGVDLDAVRTEKGAAQETDDHEVRKLRTELGDVRKRLRVFEQNVADHVCPSDANALIEMSARHAQEAKGLLVQIRYLKARVTREATFRSDLSHQKDYLSAIVRQKQISIDATLSTLAQLGLPRSPIPRRPKLSFRGAARAIIAISRMSSLRTQWQAESAAKLRLRNQAYPATRGRPFVSA